MRKLNLFVIALAAGIAAPGVAQTPTANASIGVGASVYGSSGSVIGTVDSLSGDNVIVATGSSKVAVPRASFGSGAAGPVLAATREQLDGAAAQAAASARAAVATSLVPGAEVRGSSGTVIGTVKAVEKDLVLVDTPRGEVRVPAAGFTVGATGLVLGMSAVEFDAAVAAARQPG